MEIKDTYTRKDVENIIAAMELTEMTCKQVCGLDETAFMC